MGQGPAREEAVVVRPLQTGQKPTQTALLFQSGLKLFVRFLTMDETGMLSVTLTTLPPASSPVPELPVTQRPPKIDLIRLHTQYLLEHEGKLTPPWIPVAVFDDGTRTYVKFREALTYTRAPGVFGLTPHGEITLVQSHMYVRPDAPQDGAWVLVQGLWSALELKDSTGLVVRVVRQSPTQTAQR